MDGNLVKQVKQVETLTEKGRNLQQRNLSWFGRTGRTWSMAGVWEGVWQDGGEGRRVARETAQRKYQNLAGMYGVPGKGRRPIGPELKVSVRWHISSPLVWRSRSQPREGECGWKVSGQDVNSAFNEGLELTMNQLKITVLSASCSPKYITLKYVNTYTFLPANLLGSLSKASLPPYHTNSFFLILFSMNRTSHGDLWVFNRKSYRELWQRWLEPRALIILLQ